ELRRVGANVDERARPPIDARQSYDAFLATLFGIIGAAIPDETQRAFANAAAGASSASSYEITLADAVKQSLRDWMATAAAAENLYRQWKSFFSDYDVLLCPIAPTVAFPHDTSGVDITAQFARTILVSGRPRPYLDNLAWPGLATVANLPATAIPTRHFVDG